MSNINIRFPNAPQGYDQADQDQFRRAVERALQQGVPLGTTGGGSGSLQIKLDDVNFAGSVGTLDFVGTDFDLTHSPAGELNIGLDGSVSRVGHTHVFTDITGTLPYNKLPTGGGTWVNGGALSITGGDVTLAGLRVGGGTLASAPDEIRLTKTGQASGLRLASSGGPDSYVIDVTAAGAALHFQTQGVSRWVVGPAALLANVDNTYDIGASGATRPRTGYFGTSLVTPAVYSAAAQALNLGDAFTNRWQITVGGHFIAITDNANDIGQSAANRPRDLYVGSHIWLGTPTNHVSAALLVGGVGASTANAEYTAGGRIDHTLWDTSAAANDRRVDLFSLNGVAGPGSLAFGITRTDAGVAGEQIIQAFHSATTWTSVRLLTSGTGTVQIGNGNGVFIGADPGGTDQFRVSGSARITGDLNLNARLVFTAAASKLVPGATSLSLRNAADSADNLLLNDSGVATFRNNLVVSMPTNALVILSGAAGNTRDLIWQTAGVNRWIWRADATAESGSNAGTAFQLLARADDGTLIDVALQIVRAAGGTFTISRPTTFATVAVSGITTLSLAGPITLTTAVSKIVPGATSLALRNNADSADNLLLTDAGLATFRNTVTLSSGDLTLATGRLVFQSAVGKMLMGATSLLVRDSADSATILSLGATGGLRVTGTAAELVLDPRSGGGNPWELYVNTTPQFRLYHAGDQYAFSDAEFIPSTTGGKTLGTSSFRWGKLWGGEADFGGDVKIGTLGVFDSTDVPLDSQLLVYHAGSINKWQAESIQFVYNAGDAAVGLLADNTSVAFLYYDPGAGADSPVGAPPAPVLKLFPSHKAVTVEALASADPDILYHDGPSYPADFRHFLYEYSTDNFGAVTLALTTASSDKVVHGRLTIGTTYYYRARAVDRAGNASANSAVVSFTAAASSETAAFGVILASEIAVDRLAALSSNIGIMTAGQLRNSGNTAGVNLGGVGGIPGTWTAGINFEAAAGSGSMTRYINFTATGSNPVFKHEKMSLNADGSASFTGSLLVESGDGTDLLIASATDVRLQNDAETAGVNIIGSLPGTWTRYVNFAASGANPVFKHELLSLNADGTAQFSGMVEIDFATTGAGVRFKDSGVAHGITDVLPTDIYGAFGQFLDNTGGLILRGISEDATVTGLGLYGYMVTGGAAPAVVVTAFKKNGTGVAAINNADQVFGIVNNTTALLTMYGNGDTEFLGLVKRSLGLSTIVYYDLTTKSANFTVDWRNSASQRIILGANGLQVSFINPTGGVVYTLLLQQDATGSRTLPIFPNNWDWGVAGAPVLSTTADARDVITAVYDDTNNRYYAWSVAKGFRKDNPAPVFQALGTSVSGIGAVTPTWPTHQSGDIALLFVESQGDQAISLSTPAGFTQVTDSPQNIGSGAGSTRLAVYWHRATSSSMGNPTVADPGDHVLAFIITIRGAVESGDPWDVIDGTTGGSPSTSVTIPGLTTTIPNCLIVLAVTNATDTATDQTSAWANGDLSGVTEREDVNVTDGIGGGISVATGVKVAAGTYGNSTATLATSSVQARFNIAIKPGP